MCNNRYVGFMLLGLAWLAGPAQGGLLYHWTFDVDGTDAIGGKNGTAQGPVVVPGMVKGALSFDGQNDSVEYTNFVPPLRGTIAFWLNAANVQRRGRFLGSVDQFEAYVENQIIANQLFSAGSLPNYIVSATKLTANTWYHVALTYDGLSHLQQIYINGALDAEGMTADDPWGGGNFAFGHRAGENGNWYTGILDDIQYFDEILDAATIGRLMKGNAESAVDPSPAAGAADVLLDTDLHWTAAEIAVAHDVYFGTTAEAVGNASRANSLGVLVSRGQSAATFDPGSLEFGQTYYWRIDEVGAAPASTVFKGEVWSFTVEPYAYPVQGIVATASTAQEGMGPENTVNGSGLNAQDQHSIESKEMWLSTGVQPNWIQYEFDQVYKLHELWVWNSNQLIEPLIGFGVKQATIEYSLDGSTWTQLAGVSEFAKGTGAPTYAHNTTVPFGGVLAKYVKLTINSTWGGLPQGSLSEVRFLHIPVQARDPMPADAATGVGLDAALNWRPGRLAASHRVYFGKDEDAVARGTASATTVAGHNFSPAALEYNVTYYWRVDEVNNAAVPSIYEGPVWSFSTQEYGVVDDFESYTDAEGNRIYEAWVDGFGTTTNGSQVGYSQAPFAERTIVHDGRQSMPFAYNNSGGFSLSEAERVFAPAQDWTRAGVATLAVYFRGDPNNTTGKLYLKINGVKVAYTGDAAALKTTSWTQWNVDLASVSTNLTKVTKLALGIDSGGKGVLYIDDIRLLPAAPVFSTILTIAAASSVKATGNDGTIQSINGIDADKLVLGKTTADYEKYADHPAAHADDFDLRTYASLDEAKTITVTFAVPVTMIFVIERGGNDSGFVQPLDAAGKPVGESVAFATANWFKPGVTVNGQASGAMAITASTPVGGLLFLPPTGGVTGVDPASISAVPAP